MKCTFDTKKKQQLCVVFILFNYRKLVNNSLIFSMFEISLQVETNILLLKKC